MGRTRKGKKLSAAANNEDHGSGGEEVIPVSKKRGRPLKPLKDDVDEEETEKIEKADDENTKRTKPSEARIGQKRRLSRVEEDSVKEENGVSSEDMKTNGFGQIEDTRIKTGEGQTGEKGRCVRVKENADSVKEENGVIIDDVKTQGFRPNGRRRKSKPHRAAEAGVADCNIFNFVT